MAVVREQEFCPDCGKPYQAIHADYEVAFIGDSFVGWDKDGHVCAPNSEDKGVGEGWISVKDRLPELNDGHEVLAINVWKEYMIGHVHNATVPPYGTLLICEGENDSIYNVTHWMPLPKPPRTVSN